MIIHLNINILSSSFFFFFFLINFTLTLRNTMFIHTNVHTYGHKKKELACKVENARRKLKILFSFKLKFHKSDSENE